jgi:hypothetical protein
VREPPPGLAGAFTTQQAMAAGWTFAQLNHAVSKGRLGHPFRGVYTGCDSSPLAQAAAIVLMSGGVASHLTAARILELPVVEEGDWATVPPGCNRRWREGVRFVREAISDGDVVRVRGVPLTSPQRTLTDLCLRAGRLQAVYALEYALRRRMVPPGFLELLRDHPLRRVRTRARLADPRSESPLETAVRLQLGDAGIRTVPQVQVRDGRGRIIARLDLLVSGTRVAIECDGRSIHDQPEPLYRDRERANALAGSYAVLRVTWADSREGRVVPTVRRTLGEEAGPGSTRRAPLPEPGLPASAPAPRSGSRPGGSRPRPAAAGRTPA